MTTQAEEIAQLRADLRAHEAWDKGEHTAMRAASELDYRTLVASVNDVKIAVESGINKILLFLGGGILAGATTVIVTVILNHK